jgi:hypothetical protein
VQPPLIQAFPFPSTLGEVALPAFSGQCVYLQFTWEVTLPHLSCGVFLPPPLLQAFPLLVDGWVLPPLLPSLASLFIYSSVRDCPSPPLWHSGHPALFAMCPFYCCCLLFSLFFSLFSLDGARSVQRAILIWSRVVCGSTVCHLAHLVVCFSRASRRQHLVARDPSWFL